MLFGLPEIGVGITGAHPHKIDEAPAGVSGRVFLNFTRNTALDAEVTKYPGRTSALAGLKSGVLFDRFGVFGKARVGMWHFDQTYFAADIGDTILFYGGGALGAVRNFQPGIGFSYRF